MFQVHQTLISDDIAHARFACQLTSCKGACCVVGEAGAPVEQRELAILNKAWNLLKNEVREEARAVVETQGLISKKGDGYELSCVGDAECVFVQYDGAGVAKCTIQKAFYEGRIDWEKPLSCHLFPIRITNIGEYDYLNFEFVPEICSPAVQHGKESKVYLAEFLDGPLVRKYGLEWYDDFLAACRYVRSLQEV
jgi:Fe-S-cluster containining protein